MKFKSQVYTQASGSIGGVTYSHNKGGMYTRARSIPVNVNTTQQQAVRNKIANVTTAWGQTLTSSQRDGWQTFAQNVTVTDRLGDERNIGGLAWFVKANVARLQSGLSRIDAAPGVYDKATFSSPAFTLTASSTSLSVAFTNTDAWAGEVGGALLIYASRPQNGSINSFKGPYRYAGKIAGAATPPTTPASLTLPFAAGPTGSKVFFRVVCVRADGRISDSFRTGATV